MSKLKLSKEAQDIIDALDAYWTKSENVSVGKKQEDFNRLRGELETNISNVESTLSAMEILENA